MKNILATAVGLVFAGPRYIIEAELSGVREQTFHKQGANAIEAERIKERLDAGESAESISSDLMIGLACVESFRLIDGETRGPKPLWVGEPDGARDDRPFYQHKGRPMRDPRTTGDGGLLPSESLVVDARGRVTAPDHVLPGNRSSAENEAIAKADAEDHALNRNRGSVEAKARADEKARVEYDVQVRANAAASAKLASEKDAEALKDAMPRAAARAKAEAAASEKAAAKAEAEAKERAAIEKDSAARLAALKAKPAKKK